MKILITGGLGYIGSYFINILKEFDEFKVTVVDNCRFEQNPNFTLAHRELSRITKYSKDDKHLEKLQELFKNTDIKDSDNKNFRIWIRWNWVYSLFWKLQYSN